MIDTTAAAEALAKFPRAKAKLLRRVAAADDAHGLLVARSARIRDLRTVLNRAEQRRREAGPPETEVDRFQNGVLVKHHIPFADALDRMSQQVAEARADVEAAREEYDRLQPVWENASDLARALVEFVARAPEGSLVEISAPSLKPGKRSVPEQVADRRKIVERLRADLHEIQSAPVHSSEMKALARAHVETLAARGAPDISSLLHAGDITWPGDPQAVNIVTRGYTSGVKDVLGILAWLDPKKMLSALEREIDAAADDARALTKDARAQREAEILAAMLSAEIEEEALIEMLEADGVPFPRRRDADPRAVLGVQVRAA